MNEIDKSKYELKADQQARSETISRKEALMKVGKYAAFTASTMFILMTPKTAQAASVPQSPGGGW